MAEKLTPYQHVRALENQYGNNALIPDVELSNIGFRRADPEIDGYSGLVRIKQPKFDSKGKIESPLQEKVNSAPFRRIEVRTTAEKEGFRKIDRDGIALVSRRVRVVEQLMDNPLSTDTRARVLGRNITGLAARYQDIYKITSPRDPLYPQWELGKYVFKGMPDFGISQGDSYWDNLDHRRFMELDENRYLAISSTQAKLYNQNLERAIGQLGDADFFQDSLDASLENNLYLENFEELSDAHEKLVAEKGLRTSFDLVKFTFSEVIIAEGFREQGERLFDAASKEELLKAVAAVRTPMTAELAFQEKSLRAEIKAAVGENDRDALTQLNEQSAAVRDLRMRRIMMLDGMTDYFNMAQLTADEYKRRIKAIQSVLTTGKNLQDENAVLVLDGMPDSELDKDPGQMSGDCTEGSPLPFDNPNIPVFNIKVFQGDLHVGNIYLLETATGDIKGSGQKVWHLEAIQIPASNLNWEETTEALIDSLSTEASKKGVSALTINREKPQISNYDYIAQAFQEYAEKKASKENIVIPQYQLHGKSGFQSDGRVWAFPVERDSD